MNRIPVLLIALAASVPAVAQPVCPTRPTPVGVARIQDVMATGRFIAYQPSQLHVIDGKPTPVSDADIEADLRVLRGRFDGLITYGAHSGAERVPDVAAKLGYRAVIMGIWDVVDRAERANVVAAGRRAPIVAGVSVGNEVVLGKRGSFADLTAALRDLRQALPHAAITTTEPFHLLLEPSARSVLRDPDVMLANIHPIFEPWFKDAPEANAAEFVGNVARDLGQVYCGPILVKETGVPTAPVGRGFTPARQAGFYRELQKQFHPSAARAFAYFSAFDAPWRVNDVHPVPGHHPEEAHWGLYDENRRPKSVIDEIGPLSR
jgi:exo-beta-1,3-glucanase (GH17 family)